VNPGNNKLRIPSQPAQFYTSINEISISKGTYSPSAPMTMSSSPSGKPQIFEKISHTPTSSDPTVPHYLLYFITGNPGLVGYYTNFFKTLHELLSGTGKSPASNVFHIYGQSLAGFEEDEKFLDGPHSTTPYSLEDQIRISLRTIEELKIPDGPRQGQDYDSVILMGHSVGSYILLEVIQRLKKLDSKVKIKAGILLFPTITHIAQSPSGVKINLLFRIPGFAKYAAMVGKNLVRIIPRSTMKWLIRAVASMPDDAAEVTLKFLRSRMGIWQAL
jgi:pimeloyl-ACP methyl ester carboxylesterase